MEYQYQHSRGLQLDMSEHVKNLLFQEISKALELAYSAKEEEVKEDKKRRRRREREKKRKSGYLIRFLKSYWGLG
jgi:siroheme synthase (precorrin-2 oxidase/ferrochelatase)